MPGLGSIDQPMTLAQAASYPCILPGQTIYIRGGTYTGNFNWSRSGEDGNPITIRAYPGERPIIDGTFTLNGSDVDCYGLEIMKSGWTRETAIEGSDPADIVGGGLAINGVRARLYGCIVHDVESVGFWSPAINAALNGCLIYYVGWLGPDRGHGHALYMQNTTGIKTVKDCVFYDCFGWGVHAYTQSQNMLNNLAFDGVCAFRAGSLAGDSWNNFLVGGWGEDDDLYNLTMDDCYSYGAGGMDIGYHGGGDLAALTNLYAPDGITVAVDLTNVTNTNPYGGPGAGNQAFVRALDWQAGRGHIIIYNQDEADSVVVDVTDIFDVGDNYRLRNVQDYYTDIVTSTLGEAGTISVDMRSVSHTVATPVNWDAPSTTFPEFGCFVIEKI